MLNKIPTFVETIKVIDSTIINLEYHIIRLNETRDKIFGNLNNLQLKDLNIPKLQDSGLFKLRIIYNQQIVGYELTPYSPPLIKTLKAIHADKIDYIFKSTDRSQINELYQKREDSDDILIIKNNKITDTSFCNVAFRKGKDWFTPSTPLLKGTKRQFLLDNNIIKEKDILCSDIKLYEEISLFNALNEFGTIILPISSIII